MNKNILQIITLCLCVVLLVVCIHQGIRMKEYKDQLDWELDNFRTQVSNEINNVCNRVEYALEESNRIVQESAIDPVDINIEEWTMMTYVSVTLKEWYDDTEVILLAEREGETLSLPMGKNEGGRFSVNLSFPLDNADFSAFYVQIRNQDRLTMEDLYLWVDYTQLLPLCSYGGGGWTGPDYADGVVSSDFYINLNSNDGTVPEVNEPEFHVYKNGELVEVLEAVLHPTASYETTLAFTVKSGGGVWRLEMEEGDFFEIRFCCQDAYGLGYDFLFMTGVLEDGYVQEANWLSGPEFRLFRPE